jgi:hypothetical protein
LSGVNRVGRLSFFCAFLHLKLEVNFFQCAAVRPNSVCLRLFKLNASQGTSQKSHRVWAAKLFLRFFSLKAGSEILPVRNGAAELRVIKAL